MRGKDSDTWSQDPGTSEEPGPREKRNRADKIRVEMDHMEEVMIEASDKAAPTDAKLVQK